MTVTSSPRMALAQTLESKASWRAQKARQYQDERTARWAAAALACVDYLRALPDDDDERVHRILAACDWDGWSNWVRFGEEASLWASRCDLPAEPFLEALARAAEADAQHEHDKALLLSRAASEFEPTR